MTPLEKQVAQALENAAVTFVQYEEPSRARLVKAAIAVIRAHDLKMIETLRRKPQRRYSVFGGRTFELTYQEWNAAIAAVLKKLEER